MSQNQPTAKQDPAPGSSAGSDVPRGLKHLWRSTTELSALADSIQAQLIGTDPRHKDTREELRREWAAVQAELERRRGEERQASYRGRSTADLRKLAEALQTQLNYTDDSNGHLAGDLQRDLAEVREELDRRTA